MDGVEVLDMADERILSPTKIDRIKSLRTQGLTVREIARALKVSSKTVLKYAPNLEVVKAETAMVPSHYDIPTELIQACAKLGLTPVFEETSRRIYFKKLE